MLMVRRLILSLVRRGQYSVFFSALVRKKVQKLEDSFLVDFSGTISAKKSSSNAYLFFDGPAVAANDKPVAVNLQSKDDSWISERLTVM